MTKTEKKRFTFGLRSKLLLVTLSLLIIPWIGYRYVVEMNQYLRKTEEQSLLERARMVATVVEDKPALFSTPPIANPRTPQRQHLYVRPLQSEMQIDGYALDWHPYLERRQSLNATHMLYGTYNTASLKVQYMLGTNADNLFMLFEVSDDHVVYRPANDLKPELGDYLHITLEHPNGDVVRYYLSTSAPGWVNVFTKSKNSTNSLKTNVVTPIKAEWQETSKGYTVEVRFPITFIGNKLGFAINDVDSLQQPVIVAAMGTVNQDRKHAMGTIIIPSPEIETLLKRLQHPSSRTWVIDQGYRVIALAGHLQTKDKELNDDAVNAQFDEKYTIFSAILRMFYRLILEQPVTEFKDDLSSASRLEGEEIDSALSGQAATRWRQTPDRQVNILTAAFPITNGDQVIGVVAIEETSNSLLVLQNRAMEILINVSLLAFVIAAFSLLAFATRLSLRIRQLHNDAETAIGSDGRVQGHIHRSSASDELGDLSRSFADMVTRLSDYNRYLESMASKLSHELRTPIAVVRSSLDNLNTTSLTEEARTYAKRAEEGVERLSGILTRMSEATRLEQTLEQEHVIEFDLAAVIHGCVHGYQLAHPDIEFKLQLLPPLENKTLTISGSPDLFAQMLDKLVSNAIDFHHTGTPIIIKLISNSKIVRLQMINTGPSLPSSMQGSLFDSMVSVRKKESVEAHLGLGLYIVRLIATFHNGEVTAQNRNDEQGVIFQVRLPIAESKAKHPE